MANLFDLIISKLQKQPLQPQPLQIVDNTGTQTQQPALNLQTVKASPDYNTYNQAEPQTIGDKIQNSLFGKLVSPTDTIDVENKQATVNAPVRQGGFLNDLSAGWQDNTQNGFKVDNLLPDENKTWATRLGEGLGTAARFVNSPLGRSLITGGLVAATGGGALPALAFGGMSGVINQNNVMRNKMYRDQLQRQGIDTSDIYGYLDNATYAELIKAKQLEEQQKYREMVLDTQMQQNKILNNMKQQDIQDKKDQRMIDNYYKQQEIDLKKLDLDIKKDKKDNKIDTKANDLAEVKQQLDNFEAMFDKVPNKLRGATTGAVRRMVGLASTNEANFDAQRTLLFNQIARKLGGEKGVLSDQDIKRIELALPTLSDSYAQRKAKMKAVYDLLDIKSGTQKQQLSDPLGIR